MNGRTALGLRQQASGVGLVSLVGAGPGDPELLTVRAVRRLREADVVLYDALVDQRVLAEAPQARVLDVGKRAGGRQFAQSTTERLLIRLAGRGLRVVRLKGGDPFVFGRGGEEALALARAGVPFEIVPGLSSALAGPALSGIPVTHRGRSAALLILSGHDLNVAAAVLGGMTPGSVTVVVLMARERRVEIARLLLDRGWPVGIGAAVIQSASLPSQSLWTGTLADLARPGGSEGIEAAAASLLVIGPTVDLAAQLCSTLALAA
jgi:uroporphyrin-III C-methyltransferase/precorrin-2 dehydrogenase/sirohydrochlorin ferrochelatase